MTYQDFRFAVKLANTVNWNMVEEDFVFMKTIEPEGCFVLYEKSNPIGIATCVNHKTLGWFGNLIIEEKYRNQGAGGFLVKHAIKYLCAKGIETVGLYAYPHLIDFYRNFGFEVDEDFVYLKANNIHLKSHPQIKMIDDKDLGNLAKFDANYFGGDRERIFQKVLIEKKGMGCFVAEKNVVIGLIIAKIFDSVAEVGPLVCAYNREDVTLQLIDGLLVKISKNTDIYLCLPKKHEKIINHLEATGFREEFCVTRMFLEKKSLKNCVYFAESLERG